MIRDELSPGRIKELEEEALAKFPTPKVRTIENPGREPFEVEFIDGVLDETDTERKARITHQCAGFSETDDGNALRLVAWHGEDLRYDHTAGRWLIWDGVRWRPDEDGKIMEIARDVARLHIPGEVRFIPELKDQKARLHWSALCLEARRLSNALTLARSDRKVAITGKVLDRDPYLMGLPNGTLDLKAVKRIDPRKEDLITRCAAVPYIEGATCPTWEDHIRKVCRGDPDLIKYLHVSLGYSLLGENPEMFFFVVWGKGKNGKSVTFRTVREILGEYGTIADPATFEAQKYERETRDDVVQLRGSRFVAAFETQKGRRLAESFIKNMTGGDEMKKRGIYSRPEIFTLPAKVFLCTNYKPRSRDHTIAWWERFKMIPFLRYFPPEERDEVISAKLREEAPGILQWLLSGLREYWDHRFPPCRAVDGAIAEYRESQEGDVGQWLHERCIEDEKAMITRKNAREDFLQWCNQEGEEGREAMKPQEFTRELEDRGYGKKIIRGNRYWTGFRFKTPEELGHQATLGDDTEGADV